MKSKDLILLMGSALEGIIRDLPTKRDWLDPDLENTARAALAAFKQDQLEPGLDRITTAQGTAFTIQTHDSDKSLERDFPFEMWGETKSAARAVGQIKKLATRPGWPEPLTKWHVFPNTTFGDGKNWYYGYEKS